MKKFIILLTIFVLSLFCSSCIFTYDLSEITFEDESIVYDGLEHELVIKGELPKGVTVSYTDNKLTDAGSIEVTASFEGNFLHKDIPDMVATLTIEKATYDMSGVTFEDRSVVYDGYGHDLVISGDLPEGVEVDYTDNILRNAGSIEVTASFTGSPNYNDIPSMTATLTIEKATYDMSDVSFNDKTVIYDGNEYELIIDGTLPKGVSVSYSDNKLTDAGELEVTATFTGNSNFNDIPSMTATLTIEKATYDMSAVSFNDKTVTYDGNEYELVIDGTLPKGVSVSYTNNKLTNAGELEVTATFTGNPNYNDIPSMTANLTIEKATYDMSNVVFTNFTKMYDGLEKELLISGELPDGVTVNYTNNKLTDVGEIEVVASFVGSPNYNDIPSMKAILSITKAPYDLSNIAYNNISFVYDGLEHEVLISGELPNGVSVSYLNNKLTNAGEIEATAKFTGDSNHEDIADMKAKLIITKATYDTSGFSFSNISYTYDGLEHELTIVGTLPNGLTVNYTNNKLTNAGEIEATAVFTVDSNHEDVADMKAKLTINKAIYDTSGISFTDVSYTYDGLEHEVIISGTLPNGLTVNYTNNKLTNAGEIEATATFAGDSNHEDIADMKAILTINKATYDTSGISFTDVSYTYDGLEHEVIISGTLPNGVTVSYTNNKLIDVGSIQATASFICDENHMINDMTAILTIDYQYIELTNLMSDAIYTYDGTSKTLTATSVPDGASVDYSANKLTNTGVLEVTATFTCDNTNIIYTNNVQKAVLTINSYEYNIANDSSPIVVKAIRERMIIYVKNVSSSDTENPMQLIYMKSYEYHSQDPNKGLTSYTSVSSGTVIGTYNGNTQTFLIDRYINDYDMIYCKYYLVQNGNILAGPYYTVDIEEEEGYGETLLPASKKGISFASINYFDEVIDLKAKSVSMNITINNYILASKGTLSDSEVIEFKSNGGTYYFNKSMMFSLDKMISRLTSNDIAVNLIVYFQPGSSTSAIDNVLKYSGASGGTVYAVNTASAIPNGYYIAFMEFFGQRYSRDDNMYGHVYSYTIGNEVDKECEWNCTVTHPNGTMTEEVYTMEYYRTLRLANNALKKYCSNVSVYMPITYYWNRVSDYSVSSGMFAARNIADYLNNFSKAEGDFNWGLCPHCYNIGMGTDADIIKSDTTLAAFGVYGNLNGDYNTTCNYSWFNLEVLDDYFHQTNLLCNGKLRNMVINEAAVSCTKAADEEYQCLSLSYIYYKICHLETILCWNYGAYSDSENSFMSGLEYANGTKKESYELFKHLDASDTKQYTDQYLSLASYRDFDTFAVVNGFTSYYEYFDCCKSGHVFIDWDINNCIALNRSEYTEKYNVSFYNGNTLLQSGKYIEGALIKDIITTNPTKTGYIFAGWYDELGNIYYSLSEITKDSTLYAKFDTDFTNEVVVFLGSNTTLSDGWTDEELLTNTSNYYMNEWYESLGYQGGFASIFLENHPNSKVYNMGILGASAGHINNVISLSDEYALFKTKCTSNADVVVIEVGLYEISYYVGGYITTYDTISGLELLLNTIYTDNPNCKVYLMNSNNYYNYYAHESYDNVARLYVKALEYVANEYDIPYYNAYDYSGIPGYVEGTEFDTTYFTSYSTMNERGYREIIYPQLFDFMISYKTKALENKNIVFLGDSICAGAGVEKLIDLDNYYVDNAYKYYYGTNGLGGGWAYLVAENFKEANVYNMAVGGATVAVTADNTNNLINQYNTYKNSFSSVTPDVIFIHISSNDLDYYKVSKASIGSIDSYNTNTSIGALKTLIESVRSDYPNCKIILTNCVERLFGYEYSTLNAYMTEYISKVDAVSELYNLPLVDFYNDSGVNVYVTENRATYEFNVIQYQEGIHLLESTYKDNLYSMITRELILEGLLK